MRHSYIERSCAQLNKPKLQALVYIRKVLESDAQSVRRTLSKAALFSFNPTIGQICALLLSEVSNLVFYSQKCDIKIYLLQCSTYMVDFITPTVSVSRSDAAFTRALVGSMVAATTKLTHVPQHNSPYTRTSVQPVLLCHIRE